MKVIVVMILNNAKDIKLGSIDVDRVYVGTNIVWERYKGLPREYQQVEYLQSDGNQYITTPFYYDEGGIGTPPIYNIKCRCCINGNYSIFGRYRCFNLTGSSGKLRFYGYYEQQNIITNIDIGNTLNDWELRDKNLYCNEVVQNSTPDYFDNIYHVGAGDYIYLFARNNGDHIDDNGGTCKVANFYVSAKNPNTGKITEICNLIPCYRKSDSKPGMYDMVNKTFYTNEGTGEFKVGVDVVNELSPVYKIVGNTSNIPMLKGVKEIDITSLGKSSTPFIGHRRYDDTDDTGMSANIQNETDSVFGNYIYVQEGGGIYHDISIFTEWSAKIRICDFMSYSTPNRGYDLINTFENNNMRIVYKDYFGEELYIIPQDTVASPVIYDNPFGFVVSEDDELHITSAPDGYKSIIDWLRNDKGVADFSSEGREFWLGVKDGYFYLFIEGYPICKQIYTKPIDKLNVGWLNTRSNRNYVAGTGILKFEFYNKFIFPIPEIPPIYHRVEYLQSDGYQYINTGLTFNTGDYHYIVDCSIDNHNGNQMFGMKVWYDHGVDVYNDHYQLIDTNTYVYDTSILTGERVTFTIDRPTKTIYADTDTIHESYTSPADFSPNSSVYPVILFGCWSSWNDRFSAGGAGKMYSFKYYSNNELKIDLIPCVRESDNVPGMYDLLTGNFLTNSGSGNFTAGPIIY